MIELIYIRIHFSLKQLIYEYQIYLNVRIIELNNYNYFNSRNYLNFIIKK